MFRNLKVKNFFAEDRAIEILSGSKDVVPLMAYKYAIKLSKCRFIGEEVLFVALCHYAQLIEGLSPKDSWMQADGDAVAFFSRVKN